MAEEHPSEVSENNNFPDPIEEDLSESHNSTQVNDFLTRGSSLQPGNEIIEVANKDASNKIMNESVAETINTSENIRPRSECNGGTRQLKLQNITKGRASNEILKARAMERIYKKKWRRKG